MVLMTPQFAKIVWNGARTTGNPVYPQGGSSWSYKVYGCPVVSPWPSISYLPKANAVTILTSQI